MFSVVFIASLAASALASPAGVAYVNPLLNGGSMLDLAEPPLGEPMNVIISGLSSPDVLTDAGFLNFARSVGQSTECLGLHLGGPQAANLGDGNGYVNQTAELRYDYGNADIGTCLESLAGGNHLRVFRQNGTLANTGALFLAVSIEMNVGKGHTISDNGYNAGRDDFVGKANTTAGTTFNGVHYQTTSTFLSGMLPTDATGINHGIALDGLVALLTVTSSKTNAKNTGSFWRRD